MYISYNGSEQMPVSVAMKCVMNMFDRNKLQIWAPPTPPQDENDLYIDYSMGFLYEQTVMPESQLPPIYVPKESNKRLRLDTTTGMSFENLCKSCFVVLIATFVAHFRVQ